MVSISNLLYAIVVMLVSYLLYSYIQLYAARTNYNGYSFFRNIFSVAINVINQNIQLLRKRNVGQISFPDFLRVYLVITISVLNIYISTTEIYRNNNLFLWYSLFSISLLILVKPIDLKSKDYLIDKDIKYSEQMTKVLIVNLVFLSKYFFSLGNPLLQIGITFLGFLLILNTLIFNQKTNLKLKEPTRISFINNIVDIGLLFTIISVFLDNLVINFSKLIHIEIFIVTIFILFLKVFLSKQVSKIHEKENLNSLLTMNFTLAAIYFVVRGLLWKL